MPGWPERLSVRFLARMTLRREQLCAGPQSCQETPNDSGPDDAPCAGCPLAKIESASGPAVDLLRRTLHLRQMLERGVTVQRGEIAADEWEALAIVEQEVKKYQDEQDAREQARR